MEKRLLNLSDGEKQYLETRTAEILKQLDGQMPVSECLRSYAAANGYPEQEAWMLINREIIPTVNDYNESCRQASEGDAREWARERISERVEGMSLTEEFQYKFVLLQALHGLDREILSRVNLLDGQSWEEYYEQICKNPTEVPADAEITPDMLDRLNEELAVAVEESTLPLYQAAAFQELVDSQMEQETVKAFVFDMWRDEVYKYCVATAACVAHRNGEFPSIESDISARVITLGICQGIDIENVGQKVAAGELGADAAFEIIRIAGMTALILLGGCLLLYAVTAAVIGAKSLGVLMGGSTMAFLASMSLALCVVFGTLGNGVQIYRTILEKVCNISEVVYHRMKQGVKNLYHYAKEQIMPKLQSLFQRGVQFMETACSWFQRQFFRNRSYCNVSASPDNES